MPPSSPEKNSIPFTREITDVYTAQQNYGKGIHTSKSIIESGSTDGSFNRGTIHRELFSITYRINSTDIYSPQSSSSSGVDTPPDTMITSAVDKNGHPVMSPPYSTRSEFAPITFTFTGTDNKGIAGFECSFNGSPFSSCTSSVRYTNFQIVPEHNIFQVRAVDTSGLKDPTPATFTFDSLPYG